jgi:putative peptidoglycan lipid II flippase
MGGVELLLWICIKWGGFSENNLQILKLTASMFPSVLFICLFGLNASLLQCYKRYFTPGIAPAAFNLVWIGAVWSLYSYSVEDAISWMAVAIVFATIAQWAVTLPFLPKREHAFKPFSKDVRRLFKPLLLGLVGVSAVQINSAVDALFARYSDLQGPAYLWYAIRLQQLPLALFGIAMSNALLPPLARACKAGEADAFDKLLRFAIKRVAFLMIPCTVILLVFAEPIVRLVYARGGFDLTAVEGTVSCLQAYALGLFPSVLISVFAAAHYARNRYDIPSKSSLFVVIVNIGLNATFIGLMGWGAATVALATSITAFINALILFRRL